MFPLPQNSKSARGRLAHELTSKPTPSLPKSANITAAPPLTTAGPTESPVPNHHTGTGMRTVRSWTNDALPEYHTVLPPVHRPNRSGPGGPPPRQPTGRPLGDSASMTIRDSTQPDGGITVKCWAGCSRKAVIEALEQATGFRIWDAWESNGPSRSAGRSSPSVQAATAYSQPPFASPSSRRSAWSKRWRRRRRPPCPSPPSAPGAGWVRGRAPERPRAGRCLAHLAVDDHEVKFCTHLKGKASWFLPFNKGWNDGKGNPPNPNGLKTDYLWKQIITRDGLTDIIENYAQIVETRDDNTGRKRREQIWPRYHQLDVVRRLLADAYIRGVGPKYLIQHSAGSGKSNSIAWLAHQLIGLEQDGKAIFDSAIVVTDRKILDKQIRDTIKQFAQVSSVVGHAESSGHLRTLLQDGKRIVITTVQKFPFILDAIGNEHRGRRFAIIIDDAHSSQGGRTSASVSMALGEAGSKGEEETTEDKINRLMESKKLLLNASYFAFTATPKNKTLEIFGDPSQEGGNTRHLPFHVYTMKQAIQEGFIIDVLDHYTPVDSYYRLVKTVEGDPEFDTKRAGKKLRRYVEDHDHAIRLKAEIMVDHFHEQVAGLHKIGGQAWAMVVTSSIQRAISYFYAIRDYLAERKSPYRAIAAFSGEHEYSGTKVTEASLNGFSSNLIADRIQEDPYRFLVCADKFQTGYDEPLLHTMYVDKILSGVKAVQTLSRLNRAHPKKHDAFVLDFNNDADTILDAFADYYRTTVLAQETDPDRLHDLKAALDGYQVYAPAQLDELVERYLSGADRDQLDPILDTCVSLYREQLDEDGQVDFKGKAKAFLRTYGFLAAILPYANAEWEKLSIFLTFLVPKLPAPIEDDLSKGILDAIDMDSYRVEKQAVREIQLPDEDAEIEPVSTSGGGQNPEPEMERLSNIIREFNDRFGNIQWKDQDKIEKVIAEELPEKVAGDRAYRNVMANSDEQNARIEHDRALERAMADYVADPIELFKQFSDNDSFRRWLSEMVFAAIYNEPAATASASRRLDV